MHLPSISDPLALRFLDEPNSEQEFQIGNILQTYRIYCVVSIRLGRYG